MPSSPGFGFGGALKVGVGGKSDSPAVGVNGAATVEVGFARFVTVLHARLAARISGMVKRFLDFMPISLLGFIGGGSLYNEKYRTYSLRR